MSGAAGQIAGAEERAAVDCAPMTRCSRLRAIRTAAVLLLLGAIVNVLVAWGCVIGAQPVFGRVATPVPARPGTLDRLADQPGWHLVYTLAGASAGPGVTASFVLYMRKQLSPDGLLLHQERCGIITRAGWPCRALACAAFDDGSVVGGFRVPGLVSWMPSSVWPPAPPRPLPCAPRWPGFAINTALYTAVLTCGFLGVRWSWRRIRHRPGSCRSCGYDLSGNVSGVCPECGAKT